MQAQPANATQAKDRNYMQLGHSLARLSRAIGQTADLCELMRTNLDAMRVLSASHAHAHLSLRCRFSSSRICKKLELS